MLDGESFPSWRTEKLSWIKEVVGPPASAAPLASVSSRRLSVDVVYPAANLLGKETTFRAEERQKR